MLPKIQVGNTHTKITVEELFCGDEYGIMSEVIKQNFTRRDEFIADLHTFHKLEIVR